VVVCPIFWKLAQYLAYLPLTLGLNSERTKPTIKAFYRWLDLINDSTGDDPYRIWKIEVERLYILTYKGPRIGNPLSRSSSDYVMPGDYGSFFCASQYVLYVARRLTHMSLIVRLDGTVKGFPIGSPKHFLNLIEQENEIRDVLDEMPDEVETLKLVSSSSITSESSLRFITYSRLF